MEVAFLHVQVLCNFISSRYVKLFASTTDVECLIFHFLCQLQRKKGAYLLPQKQNYTIVRLETADSMLTLFLM